jgi:hypothetical protein
MGIKIIGTIKDIKKLEEKDFVEYNSLKIQADGINTTDFLYIKGRVMTTDEANSNGDFFPSAETKKSYETFIGGIIDYNHNTDMIMGRVIDAIYIEGKNEHDYVEVIGKINRKAYVDIVAQIEAGILNQMSLEAYAGRCICSICRHEFDYIEKHPCDHVKGGLMRKIKCDDGVEREVWKEDLDLTFTGFGVVPNPADKKADIFTVVANDDKNIKSEENIEKIENKIIENKKDNLQDALKKLNALDFLNIIKSIENKNSGKTQSIAMDIMGKAEVLTEKEFYEILSKDHGKLTTIEIEDIKNILRSNKKLLGNEFGAYTFNDNGESYWVIEKYGKPEFKKKISDIWGEDWFKEDIKIDGMNLKEYAISSAFKKRLLYTINCNGIDYIKENWGIKENIQEEVKDIDVLNEIKSYINKLKINNITSEDIVGYMFNNGNPNIIAASETLYIKEKFCDCVKKNMVNNDIKLKGKQTKTDAVESYCYNSLVASHITASENKDIDINKIIWEILGSDFNKCVKKENNERVCSWLESKVLGYEKLSLSHKIFAKQFEGTNIINTDIIK